MFKVLVLGVAKCNKQDLYGILNVYILFQGFKIIKCNFNVFWMCDKYNLKLYKESYIFNKCFYYIFKYMVY